MENQLKPQENQLQLLDEITHNSKAQWFDAYSCTDTLALESKHVTWYGYTHLWISAKGVPIKFGFWFYYGCACVYQMSSSWQFQILSTNDICIALEKKYY